MSGIEYPVDVPLVVHSEGFTPAMTAAARQAETLQGSLDRATGGALAMGRGLMDVASSAAMAAARVAGVATAVTVAAATFAGKGAFSTLETLESKSIQLSASLAAATSTPFATMQRESASLFEQFRQDAMKSAGETQDFIGVASAIAGPVMGAGRSMEDLHRMTQRVMNAAQPMGVSFEQAGADVMRMLQGMAGAHEPLFRMMVSMPALGIKSAESFNKMSQAARFEAIDKGLGAAAFTDAAGAIGHSWAGVKSTLVDVGKQALTAVGSPLFEAAKRTLDHFNERAMNTLGPGGALRRDLSTLGDTVSIRFGEIGHELLRIFPEFDHGANGAVSVVNHLVSAGLGKVRDGIGWVADHWSAITAGAHEFGAAIVHAVDRVEELVRTLGGGDMALGLRRLGEAYMAGKVGSALSPAAGGALQLGQGVIGMARSALAGGGAEAAAVGGHGPPPFAGAIWKAGGAGGGGRWVAGAESAAIGAVGLDAIPDISAGALSGGGAVSSAAASASSAIMSSSIATLGAAAVGAAVQLDLLYSALGPGGIEGVVSRAASGAKPLFTSLEGLWGSMKNLWNALSPVITVIEYIIALPLLPFIGVVALVSRNIDSLEAGMAYLAETLRYVTNAATSAATATSDFITGLLRKLGLKPDELAKDVEEPNRKELDVGRYGAVMLSTGMTLGAKAAPRPNAPSGHGGQHIEVTLKVDLGESNEDAIIVRERRAFQEAFRSAKQFVRTSPLRGT